MSTDRTCASDLLGSDSRSTTSSASYTGTGYKPFRDRIQAAAIAAARQVTSGTISMLPGIFEQTKHAANRTRPPNSMEVFLKQLKKDPRYADLPRKEKLEMWKNYKDLADQERVVET